MKITFKGASLNLQVGQKVRVPIFGRVSKCHNKSSKSYKANWHVGQRVIRSITVDSAAVTVQVIAHNSDKKFAGDIRITKKSSVLAIRPCASIAPSRVAFSNEWAVYACECLNKAEAKEAKKQPKPKAKTQVKAKAKAKAAPKVKAKPKAKTPAKPKVKVKAKAKAKAKKR